MGGPDRSNMPPDKYFLCLCRPCAGMPPARTASQASTHARAWGVAAAGGTLSHRPAMKRGPRRSQKRTRKPSGPPCQPTASECAGGVGQLSLQSTAVMMVRRPLSCARLFLQREDYRMSCCQKGQMNPCCAACEQSLMNAAGRCRRSSVQRTGEQACRSASQHKDETI